jgi:hypothetical protein
VSAAEAAAHVAAAEAAAHVSAAEAAAHVAAAEAATHVTATAATTVTAATTAACERAGGGERECCCENCYEGEFLAHEIIRQLRRSPCE